MKISDEKRGFMATPSSDFCPNLKVHFERGKRDKRREKKIPAPPENGLGALARPPSLACVSLLFIPFFGQEGRRKKNFRTLN